MRIIEKKLPMAGLAESSAVTEIDAAHQKQIYPPLEVVTRPTVPTDAAAYYLNRQPQTLRAWACFENGALRPIRINKRLAWKCSEIRSLLAGEGQ